MNRFEQLCKIYEKNFKDFQEYRDSSLKFIIQLKNLLSDYFGIPESYLSFYSDDEEQIIKSPLKALRLENDSYWHIKFSMTIEIAQNIYPKQNLLFEILFKRNQDGYLLKLTDSKEFYIEQRNEETNFNKFFDHLFEFLVSFYENELDEFLRSGSHKTMGFQIQNINE